MQPQSEVSKHAHELSLCKKTKGLDLWEWYNTECYKYTTLMDLRRFWFHFSVENVQKDQRIIFNVVNLSKIKSLFQRGMTPVVKSTSRPKWQRLPSSQV